MKPPPYEFETKRLQVLDRMNILDSENDPKYDAITEEASRRLNVPISTVSIIDKNREWFKSCKGLSIKEGPRDIAFCSWAMMASDIFIIEDTLKDDRFKDNPYVTGEPFIRFYAGIKILDSVTKLPIGVFCIKDKRPRKLSMDEIGIVLELGRKVERMINEEYSK